MSGGRWARAVGIMMLTGAAAMGAAACSSAAGGVARPAAVSPAEGREWQQETTATNQSLPGTTFSQESAADVGAADPRGEGTRPNGEPAPPDGQQPASDADTATPAEPTEDTMPTGEVPNGDESAASRGAADSPSGTSAAAPATTGNSPTDLTPPAPEGRSDANSEPDFRFDRFLQPGSGCLVARKSSVRGVDALQIPIDVSNGGASWTDTTFYTLDSDTGLHSHGPMTFTSASPDRYQSVLLAELRPSDYNREHTFTLTLDADNLVTESDETNNSQTFVVAVGERPTTPDGWQAVFCQEQ